MSVLDTFYILFKSDAEDVEKGAKKAKGAVDDLEHGIGGADKQTVLLGSKFNALATKALGAFAAVFSVAKTIAKIRGVAAQSTELKLLSEVVGESASEIVNWGRAVEQSGGTIPGFKGSMFSLSKAISDAFVNAANGATIALGKMDISSRNSADEMRTILDVLPEVNREFHKLKRESAFARGGALGFDVGTIQFLRQDPAIVSAQIARQRALNPITDEDIARFKRINAQFAEFGNRVSDMYSEVLLWSLDFAVDQSQIRSRRQEMAREAALSQRQFLKDLVRDSVDLLREGVRGLGKFFKGPARPPRLEFFAPEPISMLEGLRGDIAAMSVTPLSALGAQALAGSVSNRTNSVIIDELNIATQATDAAAIAANISSELENQLSNAIEQNDDGIAG